MSLKFITSRTNSKLTSSPVTLLACQGSRTTRLYRRCIVPEGFRRTLVGGQDVVDARDVQSTRCTVLIVSVRSCAARCYTAWSGSAI